mgnify:CR=1 FL=1
MKTDIEIAQNVALKPIDEIANKINIPVEQLEHYGKYKAKLRPSTQRQQVRGKQRCL